MEVDEPVQHILRPPQQQATSADENSNETFNVRSMLSETPDGKSILFELDTKHGLHINKRKLMVRILVQRLFSTHGLCPPGLIKEALAMAVVSQFPFFKDAEGQGHEAWYCKAKNGHPATGFLEERIRNARKKIRKPHRQSKCAETNAKPTTAPTQQKRGSPEQILHMKEWLKINRDVGPLATEYMQRTRSSRAKWIKENASITMSEIMKEYPHMMSEGMVEQDFVALYPEISLNLFHKWNIVAPNILQYAKMSDIDIGQFPEEENEIMTTAFGLLPKILPSTSYKLGGKTLRASKIEACRSFIDIKPIYTNVNYYLENIEEKIFSQPFIIVLGTTLALSEQVFAVVERKAYQMTSLLKAVDYLFKLFYVCDIKYPVQSSTSWEFLQKTIYELDVNNKTTSELRQLRSFISHREN